MKTIIIKKVNPSFEEAVKEEKRLAKKRFEGYFKTLKKLNG